jgi:hypothetical protein
MQRQKQSRLPIFRHRTIASFAGGDGAIEHRIAFRLIDVGGPNTEHVALRTRLVPFAQQVCN